MQNSIVVHVCPNELIFMFFYCTWAYYKTFGCVWKNLVARKNGYLKKTSFYPFLSVFKNNQNSSLLKFRIFGPQKYFFFQKSFREF